MPRLPLRSQPGSFWLGAYMAAEAPLGFIAAFIDTAQRQRIFEQILSNPLALVGAVLGAVMLGLIVGWLGHRLGFGE